MDGTEKRTFKNNLYDQFARIGKALSSPRRLEMIDLLAQKEWSVEELADAANMSVANASRHLQILRREHLVRRQKQGKYIYYTLAGEDVYTAWKTLRHLATSRLPEVERIVQTFLTDREQLEAVTAAELDKRRQNDELAVLDVRPSEEYATGHIPGARSIPIDELEERLSELPSDREVVAYCRGPYCVFSDQAVELLRRRGYDAKRLAGGLPDWKSEQRPISTD
jgi:rhodanese-related sulfurtransferase/predicted transcriptional regulator